MFLSTRSATGSESVAFFTSIVETAELRGWCTQNILEAMFTEPSETAHEILFPGAARAGRSWLNCYFPPCRELHQGRALENKQRLLRRNSEVLAGKRALHFRAYRQAGHIHELMLGGKGTIYKARTSWNGGSIRQMFAGDSNNGSDAEQ